MLAALMGLSMAWRVGIMVALVAAVGGGIWYVHHTIWKDGYTTAEGKYKPELDKAKQDLVNSQADLQTAVKVNNQFQDELKRLKALTDAQQTSIDLFKQDALVAEIKLRKVLLDVAVKEKRYTAEIARLLSIVSGPALTEGDCEEADSILRTLIRDRMRDAGTAPPAGGVAAKG